MSEGRIVEGFEELDKLGWIKQVDDADRYQKLADAYLAAQFRRILPLIFIITVALYFTTQSDLSAFKFGRAGAFVIGAVFRMC